MKAIGLAAAIAVLSAGGAIHAAACGWFGLSLKPEVRPLEAIALAVNLFIALFLQRFYATNLGDLRAEKNVLLAGIAALVKLLDETSELVTGQFQKPLIDQATALSIVAAHRRIANAIKDLEDSVALSRLTSPASYFHEMWNDFYELKAAATGGSFPTDGYTVPQRAAQDRLFRRLKLEAMRLTFKINSASK